MLESENYWLYRPQVAAEQPTSYEMPLMIVLPGSSGGQYGSYEEISFLTDPSLTYFNEPIQIVFFYRPSSFGKIDPQYVKQVVDSIPHSKLYYCGVSLGAWEFSKYLDVGDFNGAILLDGYDINFTSETSLEQVYVLQAYEDYADDYEKALQALPQCSYTVVDVSVKHNQTEHMRQIKQFVYDNFQKIVM